MNESTIWRAFSVSVCFHSALLSYLRLSIQSPSSSSRVPVECLLCSTGISPPSVCRCPQRYATAFLQTCHITDTSLTDYHYWIQFRITPIYSISTFHKQQDNLKKIISPFSNLIRALTPGEVEMTVEVV